MDIIGGIAAATEGLKPVNELRKIDQANLKLRRAEVIDQLPGADEMAVAARWGQGQPQTLLARFDPRQIGSRLPAPGRRVTAPARQARPDFQPTALAGPPLFNGLRPYEQRAGKRSPGAFSCGPKAWPDHSKEDGRAAVGVMA